MLARVGLLVLVACADRGGAATNDPTGLRDTTAPDSARDSAPDTAGARVCDEVNAFAPEFTDDVARWAAQDALGGWPTDPVVFVGSSTIRRWEGLASAYTDRSPLQRGFGGAQLGEVALLADTLINRHAPRAVVVFAGTNDVAAGVPAEVVAARLRCLRARVSAPLVFVGITPTPARWASWPVAEAVNAAAAALAEADPGVEYVDVATPFLATGAPPDASLFGADGLHLSAAGYALWNAALRPVVERVTPATVPPTPAPLAAGARLLIDLGPTEAEDGEVTPSPDYLGQHWNNWHTTRGGQGALAGEQRVDLVSATGEATTVDLVIAGGFLANGRRNGGLLWPSAERLGALAVGSATGDFFYVEGDDAPGALFFRGLDPSRRFTLALFAARDDAERRVTRFVVTGADQVEGTLQTSGAGAGADGATTNDDTVLRLGGLRPDAQGHLFVDVQIAEGTYAYLSALELTADE